MALKWSDVAANPAFQALSFDEQEEARNQYFNEVVAPRVPRDEVDAVRSAFLADTAAPSSSASSRQELPAGMTPSTAGQGRGPINPPMISPKDNRGLIQRVGEFLNPAPKSVLEDYTPTAEDRQSEIDRRLSYGAGPISQKTVATADAVRSSRGKDNLVSRDATVNKVVKAMDAKGEQSFGDFVDRVNAPTITKAVRDAKANEFRTAGEWAADTLSSLSQGALGLVQLPINIIAPSSDIAATLRDTQKQLQAQESDVLKAQREQLRERVLSEDGFLDKYAATVVQLVTSPALGLSEAVKQVPNFLGVVAASRLVAAASAGAVGLVGRASPTVALGEAISGGAIQAGARVAGTTAGGAGASMVMAGGDAAGGVYEKLTDPKQTPLSVWEQNPDYQKMVSSGKSSRDAIEEIATAKARMAALVTAPLGLLGFMGAEAAVASRGLGRATAEALTVAGAGKMLAKDLIGEQLEEGGTQFGGNVISRTVDPKQSLTEGVPEAMGTALVTSAPFSAVGAASQYQEARAAQRPDLAAQQQAVDLFDVNNYNPSLISPAQTARGAADVGPSAPINFTPAGSPTAQAGLAPIVVPVPTNSPATQEQAAGLPPINPQVEQQFGLDKLRMGGADVSTLGATGGQPGLRSPAGGDQPGGGLGIPGRGADVTGQLLGGDAGLPAINAGANVPTGGATGQPAPGVALPRVAARATDQDLLARTEAAIAAPQNNNADTSLQPWAGRSKSGYATEQDAEQARATASAVLDTKETHDWRAEPMDNGRFQLVPYLKNEQQGSQAAPIPEPITAPSGKPFSTQQTAAVFAQQNGITGYSTVKMTGGWAIQPTETTLGTQTPQAIQGQTQGQAPAISGAAGPGMGQPVATGGATQAQGGRVNGDGQLATVPDAGSQQAGSLATPEGAATAGLKTSLRLAPPAPLRAVGRAVAKISASIGVNVEVDTAPLTEKQQAASAVARLMGRTVTFLKADTPASLPNGFMLPGDNKNIFVANDADDAPLSIAMHEIYHTLPEPQRKALNAQLAQYFRQDRRAEFAAEFKYDAKNDALLDEEIPAFMAQAISKREDFWQDLRTKMGNAEFGEVAKAILAKLNTIISGAKEEYGDEFVSKYITDVAKARDLLSTAYAEAMQEQGLQPDAAVVGDGQVMASQRSRVGMNFKDVVKRTPELQAAAERVKAGEMTAAEYDALVNQAKPVEAYKSVPAPATVTDIQKALTSDKTERIGKASSLPAGHPVGLRLDIPAYSNHGTWVVSVHEQEAGYNAGKSIGYEPVAAATNVNFGVVEKAALNIASGKPKATIAVMKGSWKPTTAKQAYTAAQAALKSKDWVQVGMDPERHSYFYDRSTMEPVVSADEVLQVGPLVLAKNPVYGDKADFMFSNRAARAEGNTEDNSFEEGNADVMPPEEIRADDIMFSLRRVEEINDAPEITMQDLVGETVFPILADLTAAGYVYMGKKLRGGPYYTLLPSNSEKGLIWANDSKGVASIKNKKAARGVIGLIVAMKQTSHATNNTVANIVFRAVEDEIQKGSVAQDDIQKLDDIVRGLAARTETKTRKVDGKEVKETKQVYPKFADFPGFGNRKASEKFLRSMSFEARGLFFDEMTKPTVEDLGLGVIRKVINDTVEPDLRGLNMGDVVMAIRFDPNAETIELGKKTGTPEHDSYRYAVKGTVIGKFKRPISFQNVFVDLMAERAGKDTNVKRDYRSLMLSKPEQVITQDIVDRVTQTAYKLIASPAEAQAVTAAANIDWNKIDRPTGAGVKEFLRTSRIYGRGDDTPSFAEAKALIKGGKLRIFRLAETENWFALEDRGGDRVMTSVMVSQPGVRQETLFGNMVEVAKANGATHIEIGKKVAPLKKVDAPRRVAPIIKELSAMTDADLLNLGIDPTDIRRLGPKLEAEDAMQVSPTAVVQFSNRVSPADKIRWRKVTDVKTEIGNLDTLPRHIVPFATFMKDMATKATNGGLTSRDVIKAYTIARSSMNRSAVSTDKVKAAGLVLPKEFTDAKIRPEGAFGYWLLSPTGQQYLNAAEVAVVDAGSIADAVKVMAPFGTQNTLGGDLERAAGGDLHTRLPGMTAAIAKAARGKNAVKDWQDATENMYGVRDAKKGFLGSLLGFGQLPTFDARQINVNVEPGSKEDTLKALSSKKARSVVAKLARRMDALSLAMDPEFSPFYQHLVHHAVWDAVGGTETTHADVIDAMVRASNRAQPVGSAPEDIKPKENQRGQISDTRDGDGGGRADSAGPAPLPGAPIIKGATGPDPRIVAVAEQYARDNGIDLKRQAEYVQVDPRRALRIANAYEVMRHAPNDPKVKEAYSNLIKQATAQYRALEDAGYKFWFIDPENDPYKSPWDALRELRSTKTMGVFSTADGFGSDESSSGSQSNPMEADTGMRWPYGSPDGEIRPVLANDLFRAVHDAFGHGMEGAGFREHGEENAWQAHARLFTGSAVGAITSETRGQNSWLNFKATPLRKMVGDAKAEKLHPDNWQTITTGEHNRTAKVKDTIFADQKTGLMPEWTWTEGRAGDMDVMASNRAAKPDLDKDVVALFKALQDSRGLGRIRAQERVDAHPMAETIRQVDDDFMDILERLDDAGLVKINCK
jgi:hypothetical protein